jgi:APA family basic amino acid/polyamine antiporter
VAGGTYEYGYVYLNPWLGFGAGWVFVFAKCASGATAALGFAGYLLTALDLGPAVRTPLAVTTVVVLTALVLSGLRRASATNTVIVSFALLSLMIFVTAGLPRIDLDKLSILSTGEDGSFAIAPLLEACALMFVAYTGYGRIATLGEEVRRPRRTIPRAIAITIGVSLALYVLVAVVAIGTLGAPGIAEATRATGAPLEVASARFGPWSRWIVAIGAIAAMLGVLLNLILGVSRVILAMGRRGDMPGITARLGRSREPLVAIALTGTIIAGLALIGDIRTTWSFSALTVLIYYAITNVAALRLTGTNRLYPRAMSWLGLAGCLTLAAWIDPHVLGVGAAMIAAGVIWRMTLISTRR